ncbi:Serine/threonine-protein kinase HT1 [Apostasia shenzhenica]|uniref:non-specific serine/threonine protein kinase n=1 Tax=Apostasia shenzhenica TaxID=1088818 RepID=A0A2I0B163_9ASPA|nr:Serine/threonine-protein kinase HT1 [Apostasia shenzhenica]
MELIEEGVGESSSPPRGIAGEDSGYDVKNDIYLRLVESGNPEAVSNPGLRDQLEVHFNRLPTSYAVDINVDRAEEVLLHQKLLADAKDPEKRPAFRVRFLMLEDLNLDAGKNIENNEVGRYPMDALSVRDDGAYIPIHEIIFSTVDKPKLLSQLSALLSDIGLNIREAHVFSTTDGYSLDVFVVDGWPDEETDGLQQKIQAAIANVTGSSIRAIQSIPGDWEIDRRLLKLGEKIGCGSCGHLYRGSYLGQDVAIKILRSEHLNETMRVEFIQELMILREVLHKNVVRFVGACTKPPQFCIVTEYMHGGSLYDYLHKQKNILEAPLLFKFALDVCKGMEYLHQKGIIHRDLKTANLLMDNNQIVKVADFGVARFQNQGGVMTAETGTYRWMAPEVINHQPYDLKVDVFSFAIVLWELATSKIPYDSMTPLQAALGVRQGLRPDLPDNMHPKLLDIMQRCWETVPALRPSFSEIIVDLEALLQQTRVCLLLL